MNFVMSAGAVRPEWFTPSRRYYALSHFVRRRFGGLGLGTHVIRIVVLGRHGVHGTGTNVAVDGFVAGGAAVPTADVTYGWSTRRAAGASGGSVAVDDGRGASLVLRFRGASIRWLSKAT